jgi:hypothetical protein
MKAGSRSGQPSRCKVIRRIPTDEEITIAFRRLGESPWATILARMLVYGLRPHEAHLGQVSSNGVFLVPPNTKTGERIVPPFERRPDWIRRAQGELPKLTVRQNREYGVRTYQAFKRKDISFSPYDCRHRFVVISEEMGIPPAIAAVWAGHSPKTRYLVYTRTLDQRRAMKYAQDHGYIIPDQLNQSHQPSWQLPSTRCLRA